MARTSFFARLGPAAVLIVQSDALVLASHRVDLNILVNCDVGWQCIQHLALVLVRVRSCRRSFQQDPVWKLTASVVQYRRPMSSIYSRAKCSRLEPRANSLENPLAIDLDLAVPLALDLDEVGSPVLGQPALLLPCVRLGDCRAEDLPEHLRIRQHPDAVLTIKLRLSETSSLTPQSGRGAEPNNNCSTPFRCALRPKSRALP